MASPGSLILVTGANGFIATHAVASLLENGYRVRAVTFKTSSNELSTMVVPNFTTTGALDEVVKGIDGALHIASPFTVSITDNETEMLLPAVQATTNLLTSIEAHAPSAKRVVLTSSFAAMVKLTKGFPPGHVCSETDWNDMTYDDAKTVPALVAYAASKALAEKAAWKFMQERKPHFDLSVLCPPTVFGPPAHALSFSALNLSAWDMNRFLSGELKDVPDTVFWAFVDVRDLATAHVRALRVPEAGNERFFVAGGRSSYQQVADVMRASPRIPEADKDKIPVGSPGKGYPGPDVYDIDISKSKRILGLQYRPLEDAIVDSVVKLIELRNAASS